MPIFSKPAIKKKPKKAVDGEELLKDISFVRHKISSKPYPGKDKTIVICCFSEFGCETLGAMYCVPRIISENPNNYVIVVGWYGREYLYKHLADEFWEVKEQYQWLRERSLAFHFDSPNLTSVEKALHQIGKVFRSQDLGKMAVGNTCKNCANYWGGLTNVTHCPKCESDNITKSLFGDIRYWRQRMVPIPQSSEAKFKLAESYLGPNPVGIIARNRKTYGRNLQALFYQKLINLVRKLGYTPIWLGEKATTLACPDPSVIDLTRKPECRDLELTLAIVSKLRFTIQFWTASTRLSGMVGTPFLLFESPDQLFGNGQEGYRLALCTRGPKKLVMCHYLKVYNDNDGAIKLIETCINEMQEGNWTDKIGMVEESHVVSMMRKQKLSMLDGC